MDGDDAPVHQPARLRLSPRVLCAMALAQQCAEIDIGVRLDTRPRGCEAGATHVMANHMPRLLGKELLAWLNANPGKASFGTIGAGSPTHVWGIYFQNETGTRFQFVPYRGAVPVMQDMLAGQLDLTSLQASDMLPHVRSEKIRAYAIMAKDPWWAAPDIPTVDAAGVPGLHMPFWHGLWVPKATPNDIIAKLNAAVVAALGDPAVRQRFSNLGQEIFPCEQQTPEALRALQKAEIDKWWPIVKAANVKGE